VPGFERIELFRSDLGAEVEFMTTCGSRRGRR
jgi:hypothetical protein